MQHTRNAIQVAGGVADDLHDARQRTAPHYNTLQHTAAHCSTIQHTTAHCNSMQLTAAHCSTPQRRTSCQWCCCRSPQQTATHYNTQVASGVAVDLHNKLQHTATHYNTLQHTATHHNSLQLTATHCNTLQHTWNAAQVASGVAVDLHDFPAF